MRKFTSISLIFLSAIIFLVGCQNKEFEKFYERPSTLADPIYQQLQAKGNFTNLLKVIDKAGYKQTLSTAGSWTFFAADDAAFTAFFTEKGISGADAVTDEMAKSIVRYSLTYDGEKSDRLSDHLSAGGLQGVGWVENEGWRRRSVYYDFVYTGKDALGNTIKVIDANRNNNAYDPADFNNKYVPIFTQDFLNYTGVQPSDYQYFYPGSTFSGFNVGPASVRTGQKDIVAENGVIHVIDKVLTPPLSIDQYIASKPEYSAFKGLLDKFVTYNLNDDITHRYQVLSGSTDKVYAKVYNTFFAPNNQNYLRVEANDAQKDSYSIIVPTNAAVNTFIKSVLLKYYPAGTTADDLFKLNSTLVRDFVNSHLYNSALWPSRFGSTVSSGLSEKPTVSLSNVIDKQALSNGFFYGVDKTQEANIFFTTYASVYLNPKYSLMLQAMEAYGYGAALKLPGLKFAIFPVSNAVLNKMGFVYDPLFSSAPFRYNGTADNVVLRRIIASHIIDLTDRDITASDLMTKEGFLKTIGNEYIRYKSGQLISAGTLDSALLAAPQNQRTFVKIDSTKTFSNGPAGYANGVLSYTARNIGQHIEALGTNPTDPYYRFLQYLKLGSGLYTASNGTIQGVSLGVDYTFFIPTNAAMLQAVTDGVLPASFAGANAAEKKKIADFVLYHIANKVQIVPDGLQKGAVQSLYQNSGGDYIPLTISNNTTSALSLRDQNNRTADVLNPTSGLLSNRAVIYQINNYLKF